MTPATTQTLIQDERAAVIDALNKASLDRFLLELALESKLIQLERVMRETGYTEAVVRTCTESEWALLNRTQKKM